MVLLKALVALFGLTSATLLYFMAIELNPFIKRCNPDVCQDYALSAFKVHSVMHMGANHCDYGVLPGQLSFNVMKPVGERWQTATDKCPLNNLMAADAHTGRVRVMLFGDSVDAHLAQHWCALLEQPLLFTPTGLTGNVAAFAAKVKAKATGSTNTVGDGADSDEGCCKDRDAFYYCKPKDPKAADRISIAMFHLPGVHLDGPFHTGVKGNFLTRIPTALKTYNQTFGGPPDLVILHSNFWDQSRMWEQRHPGYGQLNKLMPDVVFSYSSNFSLMLSTTKEYLPADTLMATRTASFPTFGANWLGRWSYIMQLNNAATEVTRLHGLPVIDLGGMVFGLEPQQYLDDQHHPNKLVLLECANIALNLLAQQRKRLEEERAADAFIGKSSQPNSKTAVTASTATAAAAPAVAAAAPSKQAGSIGDLVQPTAAAPRSSNSSNASGSTAIQTESGKQGGNGTAGQIQQQQRPDGEG